MELLAGTAMGEARETQWDTIELHRGDMLLMVSTCKHHGMLVPEGARDRLHGAFFTLWNHDPKHCWRQSHTSHLDSTPHCP